MAKKICVVTGSRAEYGLLVPLLRKLKGTSRFELQLVVCGSHLSAEFGSTFKSIEDDGFSIDFKVDHLGAADDSATVTRSTAATMNGFVDAFSALRPDLVIVLGDRYEIFAAAGAAYLMRIPLAHIHGGEVTNGALDDNLRHAITKFASLHFVAAEAYRKRVIQLGESPSTVHTTGALGIDTIKETVLLDRDELLARMSIPANSDYYLVTIHAETSGAGTQIAAEILKALKTADKYVVFTGSNADAGGRAINMQIEEFVRKNPSKSQLVMNLGSQVYLSCMKSAAAVIGNSSSAFIEAPYFKIPVINVGTRQDGRLRSSNIVGVPAECGAIVRAMESLSSSEVRARIASTEKLFGAGSAAEKMLEILLGTDFSRLQNKTFYDL